VAQGANQTAKLDAETQTKLDAVFKAHEQITKAYEKVEKENGELKAEIAALQNVNKTKELVQKSAGWKHLGLPNETVVAMLSDAQKVSPESYERVCKSFDALDEQGRAGKAFGGDLTREIGSNLPGGSGSGDSTWSRIEKAASGLVLKSADGSDASLADKVAKYLETAEGQRMYAEHQAGRKDGI